MHDTNATIRTMAMGSGTIVSLHNEPLSSPCRRSQLCDSSPCRSSQSLTAYIVEVANHAHLGEVANHVTAVAISLRHHVEEEGLDIVVQRLVVEKQLGQQTQVLAVDLHTH